MNKIIGNSWDKILSEEFEKEYFKNLEAKIDNLYEVSAVYPPNELIFNAFKLTPIENIKIVILGQDPYHNEGEAIGLSFSVREKIKNPPSLKNIFKEMESDLSFAPHKSDFTDLAKEGVFLLNTTLTVSNDALSHKGFGWERFTDKVIEEIDKRCNNVCFILWGNHARGKKKLIKNINNFVIESEHPSPLSARRGFFGSKPFSKANAFLKSKGISEINWRVLE